MMPKLDQKQCWYNGNTQWEVTTNAAKWKIYRPHFSKGKAKSENNWGLGVKTAKLKNPSSYKVYGTVCMEPVSAECGKWCLLALHSPHGGRCIAHGMVPLSPRPWSPHWCATEWHQRLPTCPSACLNQTEQRKFLASWVFLLFVWWTFIHSARNIPCTESKVSGKFSARLCWDFNHLPRLYQTSISPLRVRTSIIVWPKKSSDSLLKRCFTLDLMSSSSSQTRTLIRSEELWHSLRGKQAVFLKCWFQEQDLLNKH